MRAVQTFKPILNTICQDAFSTLNAPTKAILTDVSLRDAIQGFTAKEMPTSKKMDIFHRILRKGKASFVEVGSFVHPKKVPVMADMHEFHSYCAQYLVPNLKGLERALACGVDAVSFIVSTSCEFQKKNTGMSLWDAYKEIMSMETVMQLNTNMHKIKYKKIYISCINECPITGEIDHELASQVIDIYYKFKHINEICLSDTCGSLSSEQLERILIACLDYGHDMDRISLHLHNGFRSDDETHELIMFALDMGVRRFDVSLLDTGGCMMTLDKKDMHSNLDYSTLEEGEFLYNNLV
jgi:hydroxymethylglutaryl-CoA lyase